MPLIKRCAETSLKRNIGRLIREGRPWPQAVAIAYSTLRKACGCGKRRGRLSAKQIVRCRRKKRH